MQKKGKRRKKSIKKKRKEEKKNEISTYQNTCLKIPTDPAQSSIEPANQTCLKADATNHEEMYGQKELKIKSGTERESAAAHTDETKQTEPMSQGQIEKKINAIINQNKRKNKKIEKDIYFRK